MTAGTVPIPGTGDFAADLQSLLTAFFTGRPSAQAPVLITNAAHSAAIAAMNAGGGVGLPVIVSEAALGNVIAMDPAGVFVADDSVQITMSEEGTMRMSDALTNPAAPTDVWTSGRA